MITRKFKTTKLKSIKKQLLDGACCMSEEGCYKISMVINDIAYILKV